MKILGIFISNLKYNHLDISISGELEPDMNSFKLIPRRKNKLRKLHGK